MSSVDVLQTLERLADGEHAMDFSAHREILNPDFRDFRFGADDPVIGVDEYIETFREFRAAFADYRVEVPIPALAQTPYAVTTWIIHARMAGPFVGLEPTGSTIAWRGCSVWTFDARGRIGELRTFADVGQLLGQAGLQ